jgi:hypothetical protein
VSREGTCCPEADSALCSGLSFLLSCLFYLSHARTQLVENEEMIGALIETNERVVAALQMYVNVGGPLLYMISR